LIGVRDDKDNNFSFPAEEHLTKRLKDVLESEVDEKYFLSEKAINGILNTTYERKSNIIQNSKSYSDCILSRDYKDPKCVQIKSAISKGYEEATEGDSINFSVPNSETRRGRVGKGVAQTLDTACNQGILNNYQIRRLTPRECFRLMDFPDTFTWPVSDSQAYKQAGNSIVVNVLYKILKNLSL
jgi:DNA (cytosine-5)-methyltransferase 1